MVDQQDKRSSPGAQAPWPPPPLTWGFFLVGFTSKFANILEFTSKFTNILVNLLVKLTRILVILVDLLVKPNWKEPQGQRGGGHGAWAPGDGPLSCWWGQYDHVGLGVRGPGGDRL